MIQARLEPATTNIMLRRNAKSTGRVFRFKQLQVIDATYNERTIDYTYDALSRLQQANYNTGQRIYDYNFDLAGNRIQEALSGTGVTAKTTHYTYNAANQLTNDGTHTLTYDANGNLTNDGTSSYTWDRANRMLTAPNNTSYIYDGLGNRVSQTVNTTKTDYLLDLQPGLTKVLAATTGTNTDHYIHSVRGIHAMQSNTGVWSYTTQDGLGSVRSLIDATLGVDTTHSYDPYGNYIGTAPTTTYFGFTGEPRDANGLQYHRARYYNPSLAIFPSLDPFEGVASRPMSLNGYAYVEGNVLNKTDPTGRCVGVTEYDCEMCCWEQWRGEYPEYAESGMQACYEDCVSNLFSKDEFWAYTNNVSCSSQSGPGQWECASARQAHSLKDAFLRSAARHNRLPNMDDAGFAALIASVIEAEGRWRTAGVSAEQLRNRNLENLVASFGCVVSGDYILKAYESGNHGLLLQYLTNATIPDDDPIYAYASVGIGNVKLPAAASLWRGQACSFYGDCTNVEVSPLVSRNMLGFDVKLLDPFTDTVCTFGGNCVAGPTSEVGAYGKIRGHLLQNELAIEYVAAILEQGALRAAKLGLTPTAFNSVTWYIRSLQSESEIEEWNVATEYNYDPRGHAAFVVTNIPVALDVFGETSSWSPDIHEPGYLAYCSTTGHRACRR